MFTDKLTCTPTEVYEHAHSPTANLVVTSLDTVVGWKVGVDAGDEDTGIVDTLSLEPVITAGALWMIQLSYHESRIDSTFE